MISDFIMSKYHKNKRERKKVSQEKQAKLYHFLKPSYFDTLLPAPPPFPICGVAGDLSYLLYLSSPLLFSPSPAALAWWSFH